MREGAVHCSLPLNFLCRSHAYVVPSSPSFPINSGRCILPSFDPCSGPGGTHKLERRMLGWLIGMELAVRRPGSRGTSDADGARQVLRPLRVLVPAEGQASIASFSSHSVASSSASGRSRLFVSRRTVFLCRCSQACMPLMSKPPITQPPALAHVTRVNSVLRATLIVGSLASSTQPGIQ